MSVAWYYYDRQSEKYYFTESYSMSVSDFAEAVSRIVGYKVTASDTFEATKGYDIEKRNAIHI